MGEGLGVWDTRNTAGRTATLTLDPLAHAADRKEDEGLGVWQNDRYAWSAVLTAAEVQRGVLSELSIG